MVSGYAVCRVSLCLVLSSDCLPTPSFSPEAPLLAAMELLPASGGRRRAGPLQKMSPCSRPTPCPTKSGGKYRKREQMHVEAASLDQCAADPSRTKKRLPGSANLEISSIFHRVQ